MWKLDETKDGTINLKNKANAWSSVHKWNMIVKDKFVIMKNSSTNKVLSVGENNIDVIENKLTEGSMRQMWIKVMDKNPSETKRKTQDSYFTLSDPTSEKFLTATPDGLILSFGNKLKFVSQKTYITL